MVSCRTKNPVAAAGRLLCLCLLTAAAVAQTTAPSDAPVLPNAPSAVVAAGSISGVITDTDGAAIPGAKVTLEEPASKVARGTAITNGSGVYEIAAVAAGKYLLRISAKGFSTWKVEDVVMTEGQQLTLTTVEMGVESLNAEVNAITVQDIAEQQITAEEHQRILGILPNFFVSYEPHPQPLTSKQKFKLALVVSYDPLTFFTTGVTAGIEQAQGDFAGYGPGFSGYAQRYAATYGDRIDATFLGAAVFPTLFHQDPRYFYMGHGNVVKRALYAISTTVVCRGDNGKHQPNFSNVLGNLSAAGISSFYYPNSAQHDVQVTVLNSLLGVAEGSIGTLLQEFLLKHVTHGVPKQP